MTLTLEPDRFDDIGEDTCSFTLGSNIVDTLQEMKHKVETSVISNHRLFCDTTCIIDCSVLAPLSTVSAALTFISAEQFDDTNRQKLVSLQHVFR